MRQVKFQGKGIEVRENVIDRAVSFFSPKMGVDRLRARTVLALAGAYHGASKRRRSLSEWTTSPGDADTDIIAELPALRERSRDLIRNNPLAAGAVNTKVTSVVGTGLTMHARIDRNILGLDEDAADAWERHAEAEWRLWSESTDCDVEGTQNFHQIQDLSFRSVLENGDVFVLTPNRPEKDRTYGLQLQLIEADRVSNTDNAPDSEVLAGGILKTEFGRPKEYHILKGHPGNIYSKTNEWDKIPAFGEKTGRRNVLHLFKKLRIGQSRGVPDLAPVIETIKQLGRYTDSEINAAVISSFFTVFIKSEYHAGMGVMEPRTEVGGSAADKDYKMGSGAILDLNPNESIETANPGRPNDSFDPFVLAMSRQIGMALELPFEILVKHFTASYSAARAALLEAWRFFMARRKWLADSLCRPVYALFLTEAVAAGRIAAPGFLSGDPLIRMAYLGSEWTGPAAGQIDEKKAVEAAKGRVELTVSTLAEETAALTGGDWEQKFPQRAKEAAKLKEAGLQNPNNAPVPESNPNNAPVPESNDLISKFGNRIKEMKLWNKVTKKEWKKAYEENSAHWAEDLQSSILAQNFVEEIKKEKNSGNKILEIGCGNGRDSILFAYAELDVTAIDFIPKAIEIAKENAKKADVNINFQIGNAENLDFDDNSFDYLYSLSVLHATDLFKSIPESRRVLKKNGLFMLHIYSDTQVIDGSYESIISIDDFINLIKANNFKIEDIYPKNEEEYDEVGERHSIIITRLRSI